jgi:NTE family protein
MSADWAGERRRRGLVLGAGGVLGFAWMVGALEALEAEEGLDAREVEICVGTSAGSVLAALIGCGVGVDAVLRHQRGIPLPGDPSIGWDYDRDSGRPLPPRPGLGLGSPDLLLQVARHPRRVPPLAALSAVLPRGRGTLEPVQRMVDRVARTLRPTEQDGEVGRDAAGDSAARWPVSPCVWVMGLDYDGGRRVAFGREGAPPATLAQAVAASCAIPGWYAPVVIDGRRYVDGGTCSPTSLDLLAGLGLDEVYVLAPMASFAYDRPRSPVARLERRWRRTVTRRVLHEAAKVRASGTEVVLLGPGPEDLRAMGANLMDHRRRTAVLATSLRTSREALRRAGGTEDGGGARTRVGVGGAAG